jgi:hypothetical protein
MAIEYERPRLAVTAIIGEDIAARLDKAIERSSLGAAKLIELPKPTDPLVSAAEMVKPFQTLKRRA